MRHHSLMSLIGMALICITKVSGLSTPPLEEGTYPKFVIDMDQPARVRYDEMFYYFKDELLPVEDIFWNVLSDEVRYFYNSTNMELLKQAQPDMFEANERLSQILDLPLQ